MTKADFEANLATLQSDESLRDMTIHRQAVAFADYDIEKPVSFRVLSIEDHGVMELQLFFTRQ